MCRSYVELHLETSDPLALKLLRLLRVRLVATTLRGGIEAPEDVLILRKYLVDNNKKMREVEKVWHNYDVVSFLVWKRGKVNEVVNNELIQVITVDPLVDTPSKDQLRSIVKYGKYVEVLVGRSLRVAPYVLAKFLKTLEKVTDEFIVSLGVRSLSDVKSPLDIASALNLFTGSTKYTKRVQDQCRIVIELLYQRGVCD